MKIAVAFVALFCTVIGVYSEDPKAVSWEANDDKNNTCFKADMGIQWHVTYTKMGKKAVKEDKFFSFEDSTALTAACNASTSLLTFTSQKKQTLVLLFKAGDKDYWLDSATLTYTVDNATFTNATNLNATVKASTTEKAFIATPNQMAYGCSIETQIRLKSSDSSHADIYIRFTPPTTKVLKLQAVGFSNDTYGSQSDCFSDEPRVEPALNTYKVTNNKNEICAIVQSSLTMEVEYMPIAGNVSMKAMIPVPSASEKTVSGTCGKNRTTVMIKIDSVGNITLGFSLTSMKKDQFAETMVSVLDTFTFDYLTGSKYFPNNGEMASSKTDSNSMLSMFETPTGRSYSCGSMAMLNVTSTTMATFSNTRLQAFDVVDGTFSDGACTENPKAVNWEAKDDKNNTCFMADMGIQWHVTYTKMGKEAVKEDKFFVFEDPTALTATCNASSSLLTFTNQKKQTLMLLFKASDTNYLLDSATLTYTVDNTTFANATNLNATVTATTTEKAFIATPNQMAYGCSIETQIRLKSSDSSHADIYLRFTPPTNKTIKLQAVRFSKNSTYGDQSDCFWDKPRVEPALNTYKITNSKKAVCAVVQSSLAMEVEYMPIVGNMNMKTMIPVPSASAKTVSGTCEKNRTTMMIMIDGIGNITLGFSLKSEKKNQFAETMVSILDTFTFDYLTGSKYFPNNGEMESSKKDSNSMLKMFETPTGMSYNCDGTTMIHVTNTTKATFNDTKLQAFDVVNGTFSDKSRDCQASNDSTTIAPPVTTPAIKPEPVEPNVYNTTIMDNNITCLHAYLGLQLRVTYTNKTSKNLTEYYFNYDVRNNASDAACRDDPTKADVTFSRKDLGQTITLQFFKDNSTNTTYLNNVHVLYDAAKLPDSADTGVRNYSYATTYFKVPFTKSYECSSETDILVNSTDMTTVRMTGLKLEALPAKKDFAQVSRCFREMPPPPPTTGTYFINSTSKKNSSICAIFKLAVAVNVSYVQLIDPNPKQVFIAVNGSDNTAKDGSFGECGKNPNMTTLVIPLDGGKLNFSFVFTKTNITGDDFDFAMTEATMVYTTDTKYFPNHEYVEGGKVALSSKKLKLFASDQDHSYKCTKNVTADIMSGKQSGTISFAQVQVQPFGVDPKDGTFKSAEDCADDGGLSKTAQIGILCAIIVAGLVLIGGVACFCRRKYKQRHGYKAFE